MHAIHFLLGPPVIVRKLVVHWGCIKCTLQGNAVLQIQCKRLHFLPSSSVILRGTWGCLKESGEGLFIIIKLWVSEYHRSIFFWRCDYIIVIADTLKEREGLFIIIKLWVSEYCWQDFHILFTSS